MVYLLHTTSFVTLEEVKNYKSLQSFRYFTSGWVLEIEWKKYPVEEIVLLLGKVRHSYSSKAPLRAWVLVRANGTVLVAHCTCMAGLAETCSQVGAILHWVETAVRVQSETSCTLKENTWLMPKPMQETPYLQLCDIDFSAPKRLCAAQTSNSQAVQISSSKIAPPSQAEVHEFFSSIAEEKHQTPVILSVIEPYNKSFACSNDHLPPLLQDLFKPAYLKFDFS